MKQKNFFKSYDQNKILILNLLIHGSKIVHKTVEKLNTLQEYMKNIIY